MLFCTNSKLTPFQGTFQVNETKVQKNLSVGPAQVNKIKFFSGLSYIIKLILKMVLVAQELFLVCFIGQNIVKFFNKVKICQYRLSSNFDFIEKFNYILTYKNIVKFFQNLSISSLIKPQPSRKSGQ